MLWTTNTKKKTNTQTKQSLATKWYRTNKITYLITLFINKWKKRLTLDYHRVNYSQTLQLSP